MPPGFAVHAIDTDLVVLHNGERMGASRALSIMETVEALQHPRENLETVVRAAPSGVQDLISDASTEPWPGTTSQPNPDARVDGDTVEMWFGDEDNPVVRLPPITISSWPES